MKKFRKFVKVAIALIVAVAAISVVWDYNTRPLAFEDQKVTANPVEDFVNDATDKIGAATEGFTLPDFDVPEFGQTEEMTAPTTDVDLSQVKIGEPYHDDYDRDLFGAAWIDIDGNSCDTRNDILSRDLTNLAKDGNCKVTSGTLEDDYTGTTIEFVKGKSKVDIDHVIPLSYAYRQGAAEWSADTREAFANDPANLAASSASANRSKGDKGPSEWMPDNYTFQCEYGMQFASVAVKYDLTITQADYNAIVNACN